MRLHTASNFYWQVWFNQAYASWGSSYQPQAATIPCGFRLHSSGNIDTTTGSFSNQSAGSSTRSALNNQFCLHLSRSAAGAITIRFEDLGGNLIYQVAQTPTFTYSANTVLWGMHCETTTGTPGATLYRGTTLDASTSPSSGLE